MKNAITDLADRYYKTMTQAIREAMDASNVNRDMFYYVRQSTTTGRPIVTLLGDYISDQPIKYTIYRGEIQL